MKNTCLAVVAASCLALLSGCAFMQAGEQTARSFVAAEPLTLQSADFGAARGDASRQVVSRLAQDSLAKCAKFIERLTLGHGAFNYLSDSTNSFLSAAAAVTSPVSVARALSAGATVVGASKTSFDSEFFANSTAYALGGAIQKTYYADMSNYWKRVASLNDDVLASLEIPQLQAIHSECSLPSALTTVQSTVQAAAPASGSASAPASVASAPQGGASAPHAAAVRPAGAASAAAPAASSASAARTTGGGYPITTVLPGTAIQAR